MDEHAYANEVIAAKLLLDGLSKIRAREAFEFAKSHRPDDLALFARIRQLQAEGARYRVIEAALHGERES